ncbi:MAG: peptide methionine sulfoxide reductase [Croceitalea sp.]|nr:peptide-methionine (S)-S-oxide reductase [Croceitalea sp.]NNM17509.1 peptide methionine sulfoxide reductase [Croceitalea sp.]
MDTLKKIALGGGCHWCTEAVFQALEGVEQVDQGFVAQESDASSFSEAVVVHFDGHRIGLKDLIEIHLHTHNATANHSMRNKYRSAVYVFEEEDHRKAEMILNELQRDFKTPLVTKVLYFKAFKPSEVQFQNYYLGNPQKPFCERHIAPKLALLSERFSKHVKQ